MENSSCSTAGGALGARFKAGLQSVLNGLGKTSDGQSPEKHSTKKVLKPEAHLTNGYKPDVQEQAQPTTASSLEAGNNDAILGQSDNDEDLVINESDDALLEGTDGVEHLEPIHNSDLDSQQLTSTVKTESASDIAATELPKSDIDVATDRVVKSLVDNSSSEPPDKVVDESLKIKLENDTPTSILLESNGTRGAKVSTNVFCADDNVLEKAEPVLHDMKTLGEKNELATSAPTCEIPTAKSNDMEIDSQIESNVTSNNEIKVIADNQISDTTSQVPMPTTETNSVSQVPLDIKPATNVPDQDVSVEKSCMDTSTKSIPLSPEECRADRSDELMSPPSLSVSNELDNTNRHETSMILSSPNGQSDGALVKDSTTHDAVSQQDVRLTMNSLLSQTVANIGETSEKSTCKREILSSAGETPSRKSSVGADENLDEDIYCLPSKRVKLSSPPVEPEDRLNKLISHLSNALDGPSPQTIESADESQEEMEDDGLVAIQLKKNGLASFYDAIIKTDVVKDCYHEELSQRHQELQIKNNMDCKKIQKILHEVKSVREKLKLMNIRPAQRSVSTQICTEKLQVPPDQPGNRIIKSTVLSQKALAEQHKEAEAKKQREQMAMVNKARNDWQLKQQQAEAHAKKLAEQAAKQKAEESAKLAAAAAARAKEQEKAKSQAALKPPNRLLPMSPKPAAATTSSSEIIDLTEEDSVKPPTVAPARPPTVTTANALAAAPNKPLTAAPTKPPTVAPTKPHPSAPATNGRPPALPGKPLMAATNAKPFTAIGFPPKPLHPAPLPSCPLTGMSGHLLKPNAPRLDLSSKDDGIVLQWTMQITKSHAKISTYQIFGYKERPGPLSGLEWKKVGDLKALPLPMACTLTQFQTGHTYHFAVRAVDELGRTGPFGTPRTTKLG